MTPPIKKCPKCEENRPASEIYCEGSFDGRKCGWNLAAVPIFREELETSSVTVNSDNLITCSNGHFISPGDILCQECGEMLNGHGFGEAPQPFLQPDLTPIVREKEATDNDGELPVIERWRTTEPIASANSVSESYLVERIQDNQIALLTIFEEGSQPDSAVYDVLQRTDLDHVQEVYEFGQWQGKAYEITEYMPNGSIRDITIDISNRNILNTIIDEIGRALDSFVETGLRHRDVRPETILIRDRETLDLVITGFGSARLSEFDLDLASPLETTRYMAPEAVLGGVASESDWWSLGLILLEMLTQGQCFEGVNDQAFLIHALAGGINLPDNLEPDIDLLLRGLLARDRHERWQWKEVKAWLEGNPPEAPSLSTKFEETGTALTLGDTAYYRPVDYSFAAAESEQWDEALQQFLRGQIVNWAEDIGIDQKRLSLLRSLGGQIFEDDFKIAIALKILNPDLPLVLKGEIINAGWLTQNPEQAYRLLDSTVPNILLGIDQENWGWLASLKKRAEAVRSRAQNYEIELNENDLRIYLLSTSRTRLLTLWDERRKILPESDHRGLTSISMRHRLLDEDLIILLSAKVDQFLTVDKVLNEAERLAKKIKITSFDTDTAHKLIQENNRTAIIEMLTERVADFAHCGISRIDEWADEFRHERYIELTRALVLLAVPEGEWKTPEKQKYVSDLISFFEQKVALKIKRGPLTRMTIGATTKKIDLHELNTGRRKSSSLLDKLIERSGTAFELDPHLLSEYPALEKRIRGLKQDSDRYKKDTGIDGLYLGFPFLLYSPLGSSMRPRIAPILLWPVKLETEIGTRGRYKLRFDELRKEDIRLNPALEGFLGSEQLTKWQEVAEHTIGRASKFTDIIDDFGQLASPRQRSLAKLPEADVKVKAGVCELSSSAVLFHVAFMGQAVLEDLRYLKQALPHDTALEHMLRMGEEIHNDGHIMPDVHESQKYFTVDNDPTQAAAVMRVRNSNGLVIEGPPGTGKSQTIVNLVSDVIGHKQNLLLVCQKQAALDVVRKRLEAEGLGNRIVMVTDVNRDRQQVLTSVREQIFELLKNRKGYRALEEKRKTLAERITTLEAELNTYHQALYNADPDLDLNYRDLVSELVHLENKSLEPINCLAVRDLITNLNQDQINRLETCAIFGRDWLEAEYHNSPLIDLKPFNYDTATCAEFSKDYTAFVTKETERTNAIANSLSDFNVNKLTKQTLQDRFIDAQRAVQSNVIWVLLDPRRYLARWRLGAMLASFGEDATEKNLHHLQNIFRREIQIRNDIADKREASLLVLKKLQRWFSDKWIEKTTSAIMSNRSILDQLSLIEKALTKVPAFQKFIAKTGDLPSECWLLFDALLTVNQHLKKIPEQELEEEIRRIIKREMRLLWKSRMEKKSPELLWDRNQLNAKIKELAEAHKVMRGLNKQLLNEGIDSYQLGERSMWESITRITGPRRISLRNFIDKGIDLGLLQVRPIWLMNPDVASRLLPRNRSMFEYVVYDEASQMPVEYALPTLFRGKSVIVSGDEKQLPPTSFFAGRVENDEMDELDLEEETEAIEEAWNRREIKDCPDLLALGRSALPNTMLEIHYRSRYRHLIEYSNAAFYSGRLNIPVQHPEAEIARAKPIEVVRVDGLYKDQTNEEEADQVVKLVQQYWKTDKPPTIGVVTFNRKQTDLIEERLEALAEKNADFKSSYLYELNRTSNGEDVGFFVKNVENVQGDERDVIIFSTTFGLNEQGRFRRNFGVLGQKGGERRLNVAISRAKEKILLVTSMPTADISDLLYSQRAPITPRDYLQGYIHFAEKLCQNDMKSVKNILHQVGQNQHQDQTLQNQNSGMPDIIKNYIQDLGYEVEEVHDGSVFGIDFAIRHPETGLFGIGIECDTPMHRILTNAKDREIWRALMLSQSIPVIHRVSTYGWYHDRIQESTMLNDAIRKALS